MRRGDLVKYAGLNGNIPEGSFGIITDDWVFFTVFWSNGLTAEIDGNLLKNVKIPNSESDANFTEIMRIYRRK